MSQRGALTNEESKHRLSDSLKEQTGALELGPHLLEAVERLVRLLRVSSQGHTAAAALTSQQRAVLHELRNGARSVSDLGASNGVSRAAASIMVDRLVVRGFLKRQENPRDRRGVLVSLTQKGTRVHEEAERRATRILDDVAKMLTEAERRQLSASLSALNRVLTEEVIAGSWSPRRDAPPGRGTARRALRGRRRRHP